jgi:hypothetical protein
MRRLSRFAHSFQHPTPHGRSRDELAVIVDRYTPTTTASRRTSASADEVS